MKIEPTSLNNVYVLSPRIFEDERGYFFESYNKRALHEAGIDYDFLQDNQSKSEYGVIRGLHYQQNPNAQTKLVRVLEGEIFDVAVDLRPSSSTFGKWFGIKLSAKNKKQLLIPQGFAHGFSVLSAKAIVFYKCDNYYSPESERGIIHNDADLNIDWLIPEDKRILSDKDLNYPVFKKADINYE